MLHNHCVYRTIRCLYNIGRMYGMTTFTYDYSANKCVRVTFVDALLLVIFVIVYTALLILNYANSINFLESGSIFNVGIRYLLMYSITMALFSVCFNFLCRNKLWNIILKIDQVDIEVSL